MKPPQSHAGTGVEIEIRPLNTMADLEESPTPDFRENHDRLREKLSGA